LKVLAGNPGKRPLNENEPEPAQYKKPPRAPAHLSDGAKREWRRVAKHLHAAGILAQIDRAALEAYCEQYALWVEAQKKVQEMGAIGKTSNGNLIQNPYLSVANRAQQEMRKWMAELGATPSSRSRVQSINRSKPDEFFGY